MNELYIGLIAFVVTAAPILLVCYAIRPGEDRATIVKEQKHRSRPRIFDIGKIQDTTPIEAIAIGLLQTRRLNISDERFYGFDSPPGRF